MPRPFMWPLLSIISLAATFCHGGNPDETARVAISGRVVDKQSRGVPGAQVRGLAYTDVTEATTDDDGRFVLNVVEQRVTQLAIIADDARGDRLGIYKAPWDDPPTAKTPIEILLVACQRLPVEVTDSTGGPAEGVRVGAVISYAPLVSITTDAAGAGVLRLPTTAEIQKLYAMKRGVGFDYRVVKTPRDDAYQPEWLSELPIRFELGDSQTVQIQLVDTEENPITGTEVYLWLLTKPGEPDSFNLWYTPTEFHATTDDTGFAEFRGVPDWNVHPLVFWPNSNQYVHERIEFDPQEHPDGRLTVRLDRLVPVTGRVRFADGRPAPDINVSVAGSDSKSGSLRKDVRTDGEGNFDIRVAPDQRYMLVVQDQRWAAPAIDGLVVRSDEPVEGLEFELRPSTRVHGRVTVGPDEKPVAGQRMGLLQEGCNRNGYRRATTDAGGRYEFSVGPGKFRLSGPSQLKSETFEVVHQSELVFNFAMPRPERGPFAGRVVTGNPPRPVAGAIIDGESLVWVLGNLRLRADSQGRFAGERPLHIMVLRAMSHDGQLGGIIQIGPDQAEATIPIGPLASATARLIDARTGDPLPNTKVQWAHDIDRGDQGPSETVWGGIVMTDSFGRFEITGLVVGQEYRLGVFGGDGSHGRLPSVIPRTAEAIELGDLPLKPPYQPPTFEERVDRELAVARPAGERYDHALNEAKRLRQHVLVVFLDRDAPLTESWLKLRLDDRPVRAVLPDYQLIQVDLESEGAAALAERLGVVLDAEALPVWRFSDAAGEELETGAVPRLEESVTVDQAVLLERLARHAPEPLDARKLLEEALAEAATSNRRVIVQETATWCGPCHKLARYFERHRSIWEKDYVWVRVDQRWRGSDELMNRLREGDRGGIPWLAILDSNAKVLATSDGPDGNIGFPSEPASIDHFLAMLKSTMQRISEQELATLRAALESR